MARYDLHKVMTKTAQCDWPDAATNLAMATQSFPVIAKMALPL